jgi:FkbM family methyltransferase
MCSVIVDLAERRQNTSPSKSVELPMGITLPIDAPAAAVITPEVCSEIRSGAYSADLIGRLPDAVMHGDRVLVIGGGLGIVSTLVARAEGIDRVIVVEPNISLLTYIDRVHDMNGASGVETVNALLAVGKKGKIPFSAQHDPRTCSAMHQDHTGQQTVLVQLMDLNMILAEERISLLICDTPVAPVELLAQADLGQVDRILLSDGNAVEGLDADRFCAQMIARGYFPERSGATILYRKSIARNNLPTGTMGAANTNSAPDIAKLG